MSASEPTSPVSHESRILNRCEHLQFVENRDYDRYVKPYRCAGCGWSAMAQELEEVDGVLKPKVLAPNFRSARRTR